MLAILYYCLKVIICSGLLYGYCLLALRNNRFHQWNRFYLLAVVVISCTLPFLKIQWPFFSDDDEPVIQGLSILSVPDIYFSKLQHHSFDLTWPMVLGTFYACISLFLMAVFIRNVVKVQRLKKLYPCENLNGIHFYNTSEPGTPFSFFKNIFWNSGISLNNEKGQQMLRHEITHIQEQHSVDKVVMEILIAFSWWNPFLYYIRKELAVIHEFIADKKASAGDDNLQYASLLLMKAMGSDQYALGNPFFHTQLKRRLTMLTTNKNPKLSYLRRLMVLPLAVVTVVLFSFKYKQENDPQKNNDRTTKAPGRLQKQAIDEGLAVHGFYEDTTKKKTVGKQEHQYKGKYIESITPTTDGKGIVVRTIDRAVYFLNRDEAKKELQVAITDTSMVAPYWAMNMLQDKNKVQNNNSGSDQNLHIDNGSIQLHSSNNNFEGLEKALIIVDGVELDASKIKELDIQHFEKLNVLKGETAIASYGEKGRNGVVLITTKKTLTAAPLYVIDGVESSKEQADELNPAAIESIDVLKGEPAISAYGEKGQSGVIRITTKVSDKAPVFTKAEVPASFPGGIDGWRRYLEHSLQYPVAAQKNNTQGVVRVNLIVQKDGNLTDVKAMNDPGDGLADEAVRVIKKGPKWIPAKQNGNNVTYQLVQTLTFQLQ